MEQGIKLGYEVGFYGGCLEQWRAQARRAAAGGSQGPKIPARAQRQMDLLEELLASAQLADPQVGAQGRGGGETREAGPVPVQP